MSTKNRKEEIPAVPCRSTALNQQTAAPSASCRVSMGTENAPLPVALSSLSFTGVKVPHKIVGRREGDIEKVWANPEKANKVLGWKAIETLDDTLKSAWNWQVKLRERGIQ